jgi:hypothetical protein
MEPYRPAAGQVAVDFDLVDRDRLLARDADPAGSGAVPGHVAILLREVAREYSLANRLSQMIFNSVHVVRPPACLLTFVPRWTPEG